METSALAHRQALFTPAPRVEAVASRSPQPGAAAVPDKGAGEDDGFGFLDALSMLNPLQYLPVVGSIYRAVTGDTIPETARAVGSLVVSGLLGGVVGVAISAASTALQKLVGFDPDEMAHSALVSLGLATDPDKEGQRAAAQVDEEAGASVAAPWSRAQRAAYRLPVERAVAHPQPLSPPASGFVPQRRLAAAAYGRGSLACERPSGIHMLLLDCSA